MAIAIDTIRADLLGLLTFPVIKPPTTRVLSGVLAMGVAMAALDGVVCAPSALSRMASAVELRLRRSPRRVDVVIAGVGTEVRAVSQNQSDGRWSARLTGVDLGDRPFTPQQMVLPSSELLSVRLEPLDGDLQLIVKARMGERLPKPTIGSNDKSVVVSFAGLKGPDVRSSGRLDLRRPGRVAQPVMAPPMSPRAAAPPLGDMAVGTMLINNRSFVQASGPPVSLTLNNSPAKDALMSLARLGGYGFVFVGAGLSSSAGDDSSQYPVTMAFRNERYDRALNSILMASGLQGRLDGNTLLVGTAVSAKGFGPQMSKVFRLNQVDVASASQYLGNLGAEIAVASTSTVTSTEGGEGSGSLGSSVTTAATISDAETYTSGLGPLLGLVGTTDSRLNTITLIGDPKLISVAENYLKQIDLRKRQVAVKVQILDVSMKNNLDIDASFSSRIGNTYLVSDSGRAFMNFGDYKPGSPSGTGVYDGVGFSRPGDYLPGDNESSEQLEDILGVEFDQRDVSLRYPDRGFYSYLESAIVSSSAKVIAEPMVLVLEGEKAKVEAATEVATAITTVTSGGGGGGEVSYETVKSNAGLTLDVELSKVDDNGFVTLSLTPEISVPLPGGFSQGVPLFNLKKRRVESGKVRLRDQQTLILTGIIQEDDIAEAQKWPILGDLPLIGSLFRASNRARDKKELVVLVTPSIIDDGDGGIYGYGYSPRTSQVRDLVLPGS